MSVELVEHPLGTVIPVRARPGARREGVDGTHGGALRVSVSAAPEQGKANEAIVEVLAGVLKCKRHQVTLLSGASSRSKRFLVAGSTPDEIRVRLDATIHPS